jgi:hypothetical protein
VRPRDLMSGSSPASSSATDRMEKTDGISRPLSSGLPLISVHGVRQHAEFTKVFQTTPPVSARRPATLMRRRGVLMAGTLARGVKAGRRPRRAPRWRAGLAGLDQRARPCEDQRHAPRTACGLCGSRCRRGRPPHTDEGPERRPARGAPPASRRVVVQGGGLYEHRRPVLPRAEAADVLGGRRWRRGFTVNAGGTPMEKVPRDGWSLIVSVNGRQRRVLRLPAVGVISTAINTAYGLRPKTRRNRDAVHLDSYALDTRNQKIDRFMQWRRIGLTAGDVVKIRVGGANVSATRPTRIRRYRRAASPPVGAHRRT